MFKLKENKEKLEVELPKVVQFFLETFEVLKKDRSLYVKHVRNQKNKIDKKAYLSSTNHAFWFGKIPKRPDLEKDLYSPALIKGVFDYAKEYIKTGEKITVMMSVTLSELMNGTQDTQRSLSTNDEMELLKKIASKMHVSQDQIQIMDIEHMPEHQTLFQKLREAQYLHGGGVDVEKALGGPLKQELTLDDPALSFEIAKYLYQASKKESKDDQDTWLYQKFLSCLPEKAYQNLSEIPPSSIYYSCVEMSCRLAEIAKGRTIHGGALRQKLYDEVVAALINPLHTTGSWKKLSKKIAPVRALFPNPTLDFVYVDVQKNYFLRAEKQIKKRVLLAVTSLLLLGGIGGVYEKGRSDAQEAQHKLKEEQRALYKERLHHIPFCYRTMCITDTEKKLELFEKSLEHLKNILDFRYDIQGVTREQIMTMIPGDFLDDKSVFYHMYFEKSLTVYLDQFMQRKKAELLALGIHPKHPYELMLRDEKSINTFLEYMEHHSENIAHVNPRIGTSESYIYEDDPQHFKNYNLIKYSKASHGMAAIPLHFLGTLTLPAFGGEYYQVYKDEKGMFYAREVTMKTHDRPSLQTARFLFEQAKKDIKKYDMSSFYNEIGHLLYPRNYELLPEPIRVEEHDRFYGFNKTYTYKDSYGKFAYELMVTLTPNGDEIVLAKYPQEHEYTSERGKEVAEKVERVRFDNYSAH